MNRGVDDIVYKPTNYLSFAGKMKGLISHRRRILSQATAFQSESAVECTPSSSIERPARSNALRRACNNTPAWTASPATAELADLLKQEESAEFDSIARVIHEDDALCEAIISEANHVALAIGRRKIVNVHEALSALGTRRIGEIASALRSLPS